MGRRILNRKDLRADYDAAERRKGEEGELDETETEEEDEDEEAGDDEEAAGEGDADAEEGGEAGDDEDEDAEEKPAKKKAVKAKAKVKAKPKSRSRASKVVRMKVVWGVFNNSNQRVAVFDYPKRKDADDLAAKLCADKKTTHFVQPVKEPIEEKKEKE